MEPAIFGKDLFGVPVKEVTNSPVKDQFIFPPFTVLDAKQGAWARRKRAWIDFGIDSGDGRGKTLLGLPTTAMLSKGNYKSTMDDSTSIFDPVLCELLVRWFSPKGGQVIDPFAGGSVRGVISGFLGRNYTGIDVRPEQIEANEKQRAISFASNESGYGPDELTPVETANGGILHKRDDLCVINGARGGKARTCFHLAKQAKKGLTTAGSRHSPQVYLVAAMAKELGLPFTAHVPSGEIKDGPVLEAKKLGAEIIQHKPGYNSVIIARAKEYAEETGFTEIPFGMECDEAITQTRNQVSNIPKEAKRLVIAVGSGMSLCGVLHGLADAGRQDLPVIAIWVGADPEKRINQYAPEGWENQVTLIKSDEEYSKHIEAKLGGVDLDPVYEAKAHKYLEPGDVFWNVGHREPFTGLREYAPKWILGDSLEVASELPEADFILSCPPYGNLEVYSDLEDDISNMSHAKFCFNYLKIIKETVKRLKNDRFIGWVIGDFRDPKTGIYQDFVSLTIGAFRAAGCSYYNDAVLLLPIATASMRVTRFFNGGRKFCKVHQNVLVFVKGDWKTAAKACGKVTEFEEQGMELCQHGEIEADCFECMD